MSEPQKDIGPWLRAGGRWMYAAAWLPFLTVFLAAFVTGGIPLGLALRNALANLLPDALLGLIVLRVASRLPWPEGSRSGFFIRHLGLLAAFTVASAAGWLLLLGADQLAFGEALNLSVDPRIALWRSLNDMLVYAALAGVSYAWHHAAESRAQAARAGRAEVLRARAELEAMRSQLNPHFILNTLHALVGLVRREPAVAEQAIERLGDLLRYSLRVQREGLDEVTLREEWAFVQAYLDLERLRLGDRLRTTFDAGAGTLDRLVPSFALQTLAENAIRHAIAPRADGGSLSIRAHQVDGRLTVEVQDEGAGAPAAPAEASLGVGLKLLRDRLAALYDGRAALDLRATPGGPWWSRTSRTRAGACASTRPASSGSP
ncbi:MAG: histidine kinase [Acidobacteria bacterium]|nr:histidine kinase [Acidobacteriota bacterium]